MPELTPQDATRYWLSRRTGNDLFLLYGFDEPARSTAELRTLLTRRAAAIPDLRLRVRERRFAYPAWTPCGIADDQIVVRALPEPDWANLVVALEELAGERLHAGERAWRLHLYRGVRGGPAGAGAALIAVLQLSHALADGRRAAAIARDLFAAAPPTAAPAKSAGGMLNELVAEVGSIATLPVDLARTVIRGLAANRARRELADRTARGEIAAPAPETPPTPLNNGSEPRAHAIRMLVRTDLRVPGHTVTVVTLTAIGAALARYLESYDHVRTDLAAQVSIARSSGKSRNNYRDSAVELHTGEPDHRRRADRIAATLAARRARAGHPLLAAQDRVTEAIPAPILRRDVFTARLDQLPATLSAHTVVSSVDRGPADLVLAAAPVRFTAGFPALGTVMHLTHGVHGLGETITVSVHADPAVLPDPDRYAALLDHALSEVVSALRE